MPRSDRSSYLDKQKHKAEHIEEGYGKCGTSHAEAERRAWATVNAESGGGKKSVSGGGKAEKHASSRKDGYKGGSSQTQAQRSAAAKGDGRPAARRLAGERRDRLVTAAPIPI